MFSISRLNFIWICALLIWAVHPGVAPGQAEKLHAGYSIYTGVTGPLWVTKEAGLFEKNGLSVELIFFRGGTEAAQALISGDVPFAMMGANAVIASNLAGSGNVIVAGLVKGILFKLVTSKDITRAEHLRGKRLGVASMSGSTYLATTLALQHLGIKPNEVTILAVGNAPTALAALRSGSTHGAVLLPPETLVAKKLGLNFLLDLSSVGMEFQTAIIAAGREAVEKKPHTVKKFMKALVTGIHTYKTDKNFSLKVLRKYFKTDDAEVIEETYNFYSGEIQRKPYPTLKGIQAVLGELAKRNPKAKDSRPAQFVNLSFLKELDETGYIDNLYKTPPK